MGGLIWLASYPKSGNTWMRLFLTNYRRDADSPAGINDLGEIPIASARLLFDDETGVESSDLTMDETDGLRAAVYRHLVRNNPARVFMKVHDAYRYLPCGQPMFPPDVTTGVVYIIRNPLDVAVSLAAYNRVSITETIRDMASEAFTLCGDPSTLEDQLRQPLLSWSGHVRSWVDANEGFPVHVVRYEDMSRKPQQTFAQVISFIGLGLDEARLKKALAFSAFDVVQRQEQTSGFEERPSSTNTFFRTGRVGAWREHLDTYQVARLVDAHHDVMHRFGYLTTNGVPVY